MFGGRIPNPAELRLSPWHGTWLSRPRRSSSPPKLPALLLARSIKRAFSSEKGMARSDSL